MHRSSAPFYRHRIGRVAAPHGGRRPPAGGHAAYWGECHNWPARLLRLYCDLAQVPFTRLDNFVMRVRAGASYASPSLLCHGSVISAACRSGSLGSSSAGTDQQFLHSPLSSQGRQATPPLLFRRMSSVSNPRSLLGAAACCTEHTPQHNFGADVRHSLHGP